MKNRAQRRKGSKKISALGAAKLLEKWAQNRVDSKSFSKPIQSAAQTMAKQGVHDYMMNQKAKQDAENKSL